MVSGRLSFEDFSTAYAYIYWRDLLVLITTGSLLHAIHQTYDHLLQQTELETLRPKLANLLERCRTQLRADAQANTDLQLKPFFADLAGYLAVGLVLLGGDKSLVADKEPYQTYLALAEGGEGIAEISLSGLSREIDFSLFHPRGQYTKNECLQRYFRAMTWLAQVDFRLVEYDAYGVPSPYAGQIVAAALFLQTIARLACAATGRRSISFSVLLLGKATI